MAPPTDRGAAKTSLPVIAAVICGGVILLLLASTIVLALIPIYIPQKTVPAASRLSNEITQLNQIAAVGGRRRRENNSTTDPLSLIGFSLTDSTSVAGVKKVYLGIIVGYQYVSGMTDPVCQIVIPASSGRKRQAFSKRQSNIYALSCAFKLIFSRAMSDGEKNTRGPAIENVFKQGFQAGKVTWPKLTFTKNGILIDFKPIHIGFFACSTIGAPGSKNDNKNTVRTIGTTPATSPGVIG